MSAAEAVADVKDGASVSMAGFGLTHRYPTTLVSALAATGVRNLTLYCNGLGQVGFPTGALLVDNHQVGHLVTCFSARPGTVSEAEKQIAAGEMTLEMVPQGTLVERMRAGGAGLAAIYTPTGYGSAVADGKDIRYFDGRPYVLERAIRTDYALLRAAKADHFGNVSFRGTSQNFNTSFAKAARVAIVEAEEIVPTGAIPPGEVDLPGLFVSRVVPITNAIDVHDLPRRPGRAASSAREYLGKPDPGRDRAADSGAAAGRRRGEPRAGDPGADGELHRRPPGEPARRERAAELRRFRGRGLRPGRERRRGHVRHAAGRRVVLRLGDLVRDRPRGTAVRRRPWRLPGRRER